MTMDFCATSKLISLDQALTELKKQVNPLPGMNFCHLRAAYQRILAQNIISPMPIPPERNAAMDGYAFNSEDIRPGQSFELPLCGVALAGQPYQGSPEPHHCLRIFTGAVVPEPLDSVIMQEHVKTANNRVHFPPDTAARQFIRSAGCDVEQGQILLPQNKSLNAADIALLAAAGIYEVPVLPHIKIAFCSTGDELRGIGHPLSSGEIYDSNRYLLHSLLARHSTHLTDLGVLPDHPAHLTETLLQTAQEHDLIITSGGASVGEADFIHRILSANGEVHFWKLAIKPGKPVIFGRLGQAYLLGLPGNPVSLAVTFYLLGIPLLRLLNGQELSPPLRIQAVTTEPLKKDPGRQEYQRGILSQNSTGNFEVRPVGRQGSHILSGLSQANCFIVLPADCEGVQAGSIVIAEPLDQFL
jgi:molybdopterin molybdotransferase